MTPTQAHRNPRPGRIGCAGLLLATALAGCGGGDGPMDGLEIQHSSVRDTLQPELVASSPAIGLPSDIVAAGGLLWVKDLAGDPYLHVIDAENGEVLASLGRRGDGGGEFQGGINGMRHFFPDTTALWAFDPTGQRLTRVQLGVPSSEWATIRLLGSPYVSRTVWLDPDTFMGVSGSEDARYLRLRLQWGTRQDCSRRVPWWRGGVLGGTGSGHHHRIWAVRSPGRRQGGPLLQGTSAASSCWIQTSWSPRSCRFRSPATRSLDRPGWVRSHSSNYRSHYTDCAAADNRFYMLYSGTPLDGEEPLMACVDSRGGMCTSSTGRGVSRTCCILRSPCTAYRCSKTGAGSTGCRTWSRACIDSVCRSPPGVDACLSGS